jgi:hypothetical protein
MNTTDNPKMRRPAVTARVEYSTMSVAMDADVELELS